MNISHDDHVINCWRDANHNIKDDQKLKDEEFLSLGKATTSKIGYAWHTFLYFVSFTFYNPILFYQARAKQVILRHNLKAVEKNLIKNVQEKKEKIDKKIQNIKDLMKFIQTQKKEILPTDSFVDYTKKQHDIHHVQLIFKFSKASNQELLKNFLKKEDLENLIVRNSENQHKSDKINQVRLLMKYEDLNTKKSNKIEKNTLNFLLKFALNGKNLIDINNEELKLFRELLNVYNKLPEQVRKEVETLLLNSEKKHQELAKAMLLLASEIMPEESRNFILLNILSIKNFNKENGVNCAQIFVEQLKRYSYIQDVLEKVNLDSKFVQDLNDGKYLTSFSQAIRTFSELKEKDIEEKFVIWIKNYSLDHSLDHQFLEKAPYQFIHDVPLKNFSKFGFKNFVEEKINYKQNNFEKIETLNEIFSLEKKLMNVALFFEEVGFGKNFQAYIEQQLQAGAVPKDILLNLAEIKKQFEETEEYYHKLDLENGTNIKSVFVEYLKKNSFLLNKNSFNKVKESFNSMQWELIKPSIKIDVIQQTIEKALEGGKYHYTEIEIFQSYQECTKIIGELKQNSIKKSFESEISILIQKNIKNQETAELSVKIKQALDVTLSILRPLTDLQKQYGRYGLKTQFKDLFDSFLKRKEIKTLNLSQKIEQFLKEQESERKLFDSLNVFQTRYFQQKDLKDLFDRYTTRFIELSLKKTKEVLKVLQDVEKKYYGIVVGMEAINKNMQSLDESDLKNFQSNFISALQKYFKQNCLLTEAIERISTNIYNMIDGENVELKDLEKLKDQFGTVFADRCLQYTQKGIVLKSQEKKFLDMTSWEECSVEELMKQIVPFFTHELNLNQTAKNVIFKEDFVQQYLMSSSPENVSDRMAYLMYLADIFKHFSAHQSKSWTSEQIEQLIKDFDGIFIHPQFLISDQSQHAVMSQLFDYYLKNNQEGKLSLFIQTLHSSPTFIQALSLKDSKHLSNNLKAFISLSKYFLSFSSKKQYEPIDIANGMRFLIEEESKNHLNLTSLVKELGENVSLLVDSKMEKKLFEHTFYAFVMKWGSEGMNNKKDTQHFISNLVALFEEKTHIPNKASLEMAKKIIEKARGLVLEGQSYLRVINGLQMQKGKKTLSFNLKQMKSSKDEMTLLETLFVQMKKELEETSLINNQSGFNVVQQNPFKAITFLVSVLVGSLLPEKDKHKIKELENHLNALEIAAKKLPVVEKFCKSIALLGSSIHALIPNIHNEVGKRTIEVSNCILKQIHQRKNELQNIDESNQPQDIDFFQRFLVEEMLIPHIQFITKDVIECQKIRSTNKNFNELELSDSESFFLETLPEFCSHMKKLKFVLSLLPTLLSLVNISGKVGEKAAQLAIGSYLKKAAPDLSSEEKAVVLELVSCLVKILSLTGSSILKNHDLNHYLDFFSYLNDFIQSSDEINKQKKIDLELKFLEMTEQFIKEMNLYENGLDELFKAIPNIK